VTDNYFNASGDKQQPSNYLRLLVGTYVNSGDSPEMCKDGVRGFDFAAQMGFGVSIIPHGWDQGLDCPSWMSGAWYTSCPTIL
jgi:hypothetical protein